MLILRAHDNVHFEGGDGHVQYIFEYKRQAHQWPWACPLPTYLACRARAKVISPCTRVAMIMELAVAMRARQPKRVARTH
jgi:hypothetical protein